MSQNRYQLPPFLSSWKSLVGLFVLVLAIVMLILGRFDLFQTLVLGVLGVMLI